MVWLNNCFRVLFHTNKHNLKQKYRENCVINDSCIVDYFFTVKPRFHVNTIILVVHPIWRPRTGMFGILCGELVITTLIVTVELWPILVTPEELQVGFIVRCNITECPNPCCNSTFFALIYIFWTSERLAKKELNHIHDPLSLLHFTFTCLSMGRNIVIVLHRT